MGPVGVGRRAVKEGGYGLTTVPPALPYPTHQKPGTQRKIHSKVFPGGHTVSPRTALHILVYAAPLRPVDL